MEWFSQCRGSVANIRLENLAGSLFRPYSLIPHMRRFPKPQHFFVAQWQNWDFAIEIILYHVIKVLWNFLFILFGCCSTQVLNFNAKTNFANISKIIQQLGRTLIFGQFSTYLQNCFLHWNSKSEGYNTQINAQKFSWSFYYRIKNDRDCKIPVLA